MYPAALAGGRATKYTELTAEDSERVCGPGFPDLGAIERSVIYGDARRVRSLRCDGRTGALALRGPVAVPTGAPWVMVDSGAPDGEHSGFRVETSGVGPDQVWHNEFRGTAEFVVMARDITGPVTYAPTVVTDDPADRAARELARMVSAQWRHEAGVRGLLDPVSLPVRWTAAWQQHDQPPMTPGDGLAGFADTFRRVWHRRLVVLGEPGSGKSTLAVLLLLGLLEHQPGDLVPVLFSMASWDPAREHLHRWLARRILEDYPRLQRPEFGGTESATRLLEARRVLPVLDGLDEIPQQRRVLALRRLNEALAGDAPVILTCRSGEYADTVGHVEELRSVAVVRANPVRPQDGLAHLRAAVPRPAQWQAVFAALDEEPDGPLAVALSTPLMIGLLRTVHRCPEADPAVLLDRDRFPDAAAIENHLLDSLLPTAFSDAPTPPDVPGPRVRWKAARAERWLRELAGDLTRRRTEDLAWWQFGGTPMSAPRLTTRPRRGLSPGAALAWVMLVCLLLWGCVAVFAVLATWLFSNTPHEWALVGSASVFWLGVWVVIAFVVWLFRVVRMPFYRDDALTPRRSLALGRRRTLTVAFTSGLVVALAAGTAFGTLAHWAPDISQSQRWVRTIGIGAVPGVLVAVWAWLRSTWSRYVLLRTWLALRGRLPWRLMTFLEHAHRVSVLRQLGGAYQFRHARLKERLAARRS
jgi:energy-coupling factor transporter ATP-binding protein EcfA2